MAAYTWIVTKDEVDGNASDAVGKIGPPGQGHRYRFDRVITAGREFRMLSSEGKPKFSGFILGEYRGSEPLDEYGRYHGCVSIQYRESGRWVAFGGAASPRSDTPGYSFSA